MTFIEDSLARDAETVPPTIIVLSDEEKSRAVTQTETIRPAEGWQAYLNAIAWVGFQHWLEERGVDLDDAACSVTQPAVAGLLGAVCNLEVNGFRLCLLPTGSLDNETVSVPRAAVELDGFAPQLFVLIEVWEETDRVMVQGALRSDQLQALIAAQPGAMTVNRDWTYTIPKAWFEESTEDLLLYLRCLPTDGLPTTPAIAAPAQPAAAQVQDTLATLERRLQSRVPLWKLLTWEQAAVVLTQPELLQPQPVAASPNPVAQAAINFGQWVQQLNPLHNQDWLMLPPVSQLREAAAMRYTRSPVEQFEDIITTLGQQGTTIPPQARAAYRDLAWQSVSVRLYAIAWDISTSSESDWCLLLLLGPQPNQELPVGITIRMSDDTGIIDEQTLEQTGPDAYLFSQVVGERHEQFQAQVNLTNGAEITLPPFTYRHD